MHFILTENNLLHESPATTTRWQQEFDMVAKEHRIEIVAKWLQEEQAICKPILTAIDSGGSGGRALLDAITRSIELRTFAEWANPYLKLIKKFRCNFNDQMCTNLASLVSMAYDADALDLNAKYLTNASLYNRDAEDFVYTIKVFNIVSDKSKLKSYFKNTSNIDIAHLYKSSSSIKPAGIKDQNVDYETLQDADNGERVRRITPPEKQRTIYGTIEAWSDNGNDSGGTREDKPKQSNMRKVSRAVYKSTEDATRDGMDIPGNTITVQSRYTYDGKERVPSK